MIDTLHLELHDLQKHLSVCQELANIKKGSSKFDIHKSGGTLRHSVNEYMNEEETKLSHSFTWKPKEQPSSHYQVIFFVSEAKNSITINFSIPKYFYATNILQAVTTPFENEIMLAGEHNTIEYQLEKAYERLYRYIYSFFKNEFPNADIDYTKLELKRVDLCFNQFFQSKRDALKYLKYQKSLKRKYFKENQSDVNNYKTAVFYANDDYSYKVYHKGTEYAKNDRLEHEKINRKFDKQIFDTDLLQSTADNILRYEFTFRQSYMSYLYNQKVFRRNSFNFKQFKKLYNSLKAAYDKKTDGEQDILKGEDLSYSYIKTTYEKHGSLVIKNYHDTITKFLFDWYSKRINETKPNKHEIARTYRRFFKDFDNMINTRRRIWFDLTEEEMYLYEKDNLNNKNFYVTEREIPLSRELFKQIGKRFSEFVNEFQIQRKQTTDHYLEQIEQYNRAVKGEKKIAKTFPLMHQGKLPKTIDKCKLGLVLMALETYDLKDVQNILGFSRMTMYNYKMQLAAIGYTNTTINEDMEIIVDTTFSEYFNICFKHQRTLFITHPLMADMMEHPLEGIA